MTILDLFDRLGGVTKVALATGTSVKTVSAWKTRRSIPVDHWPAFIALAKAVGVEGVTAESLLAMHAGADARSGSLSNSEAAA